MRWAAVLIAAVSVSACAAGISASVPSPTRVQPQYPADCKDDLTEPEGIAREILSGDTQDGVYSQALWDAGVARATELLSTLRANFPSAADIRAEFTRSSEMLLQIKYGNPYKKQLIDLTYNHDQIYLAGEQTGVSQLDELDPKFAVRAVWIYPFQGDILIQICFDKHANFREAAAAYMEAFATDYVFRYDGRDFDRPTLNMADRDGDTYAVVRQAGGDCLSGCTTETISMLRIHGAEVSQLTDAQILADPFLVQLVASVRSSRAPWQGNGSVIPVVPETTPAVLPQTGGPP